MQKSQTLQTMTDMSFRFLQPVIGSNWPIIPDKLETNPPVEHSNHSPAVVIHGLLSLSASLRVIEMLAKGQIFNTEYSRSFIYLCLQNSRRHPDSSGTRSEDN
jgi:hypothetical protein